MGQLAAERFVSPAAMGYPRGVSIPEGDATLTAMDRLGDAPRSIVELAEGGKVGRYVIERRLGAGGMGVVYAARDTALGRDVALKIVRPRADVDAMQARLRREAKAMARLSHRNVVPVFDIGTHDGQLFIAMELVAGDTLRSWVVRPRPWRRVVQLFAKAGRGLEAAHAAGLLHRDFKPDNVVVGQGDEPRITDFGLARDVGDGGAQGSVPPATEDELSLVTATGSLAGTPAYMAPEQLLGRTSGAAADQFSFCVSLFEALYGMRPFRPAAPRPEGLIAEVRAGRIVRPASRGVPRWVHQVLVRGLAFEAAQRWPSLAALVDALEGRRRARRMRIAGAVAAAAVVVAGGVGIAAALRGPGGARCADIALRGNDAATIVVCRDEYARSNDPQAGRQLANALRRTGKLDEAATVANGLLATSEQPAALYTLGKVAAQQGRFADAERSLRMAAELHRARAQWSDAASDLQAVGQAAGDPATKLMAFDQAVGDAQRGRDGRTEGYCRLGAAGALSEIGARESALAELERARPLLTAPSDAVMFDLKRGDALQNLGDNALAVAAFESARRGAETLNNTRNALSARLNLVYSLAETGREVEAAAELKAASALDPHDEDPGTRLSLEARVAVHTGDLARAADRIDRAIAAADAGDMESLASHHVQRAEIALARGELATAEQSARRAIALFEQLRSSQATSQASTPATNRATTHAATQAQIELQAWLNVDNREPHELLFASLARRGDAAGALAVFEHRRGLDVLARLVHGDGVGQTPTEAGVAFPVAEFAQQLPGLGTSALVSPPSQSALGEALRSASLLVLVVAADDLWRITVDGGRLDVARLGPMTELGPTLARFRAAPGDRAAAAALGERLLPPALAQPSDRVLDVVLDAPLADLPVAALRIGDRRLVASRTVALLARASDAGCAAPPDGPRRVVAITAASGRADLLDAARGDLLQIVAPHDRDALGDVLAVGDGRVGAAEIAGHGHTAAQVLVAVPDAGAAGAGGTGHAGATDLAMAFLAAGADQVIAAVRPVPPAALARLTRELPGADRTDLIRGLARLQRAGDGDDWLGFAAFGRDTCHSTP